MFYEYQDNFKKINKLISRFEQFFKDSKVNNGHSRQIELLKFQGISICSTG